MLALPVPMPIYEYKCPNGHLFEVFHGMTEAGPDGLRGLRRSPLQVVLHPVAVHYKGSGFYSTDYGAEVEAAGGKDGGGSSDPVRRTRRPLSSSKSSSEGSSSSGDSKKAAEA